MPPADPRDAVNRALDVLERFLDEELSDFDRALALNDLSVPEDVVLGFLRVLHQADRLEALARCWRPAILAGWFDVANHVEVRAIARNWWTPPAVFRQLLNECTDEALRVDIAHGCVEDAESVAWLLADPSPLVRAAMREAMADYRALDEQMRDQFRAEAPVEWLHEAVPAAEAEDLLEVLAAEELERKYSQLCEFPLAFDVDEPPSADDEDPELNEAVAVLKGVFGPDRVLGDFPLTPRTPGRG